MQGGPYHRVADPNWVDPIDPSFAAMPPGQRFGDSGICATT